MENRLKEIIRGIVKEIQSEKELEEMTGTGGVAGYDTPAAFSKPGQTAKKNKRLANVSGGDVVNDLEEGLTSSAGAPFSKPSEVAGKNAKLAKLSGATVVGEDVEILNLKQEKPKVVAVKDVKDGEIADVSGMELAEDGLHLAENRWLAIKKEDGSAKAKIGKGISSIHNQLSEVEKFVNWYSKLKTENGVKKEDYYKRTHKSLGKIKERLMNLSEKIRTL
jgi:hypothetical protein